MPRRYRTDPANVIPAPRIALPAEAVARQPERGLAAAPGLHPGHPPLLQLRDDARRHLFIEVAPFRPLSAARCLMILALPHGPLLKSARLSPEAGWAAKSDREARGQRRAAPEGPERSGGVGGEAGDLRTAAAGLQGSAAHPARRESQRTAPSRSDDHRSPRQRAMRQGSKPNGQDPRSGARFTRARRASQTRGRVGEWL